MLVTKKVYNIFYMMDVIIDFQNILVISGLLGANNNYFYLFIYFCLFVYFKHNLQRNRIFKDIQHVKVYIEKT